LFGKATITAKPYFYPTAILELDARGMEIKEVALLSNTNKLKLDYNYTNDVIKIKLNKEYKSNEIFTVFIEYVSKPNELKSIGGSAAITSDKGLYFINPLGEDKNKPTQIWTQGETQSNSVWFPTIDRPNERMTDEIYITIPDKYVSLSNGELTDSKKNNDSTRTDHWQMKLPHAPYLVMMAIGDFAIVKDRWRNKEVNYFVDKKYEPYAKAIFGNTPEMLEFFSSKLGVEFAWNKYAQVVVHDYVSGAMENTSATLHGEFLQQTEREMLDGNHEDVISHELFHQWFGDLVTCESWSNIPLNESFATYGEYLWNEYKYGRESADAKFYKSREGYFNDAKRKQVNLIRFNYNDKEEMFDGHSYNKGGQILNMLRNYVGDDAFFASLKLYLETNKFKSVEIHNLRLAFEETTGEDLNWFFNQWFLSSGHPVLDIKYEYNADTKKAIVKIIQKQNLKTTPLYKLPLIVDIYIDGKILTNNITIEKLESTFEFDVNTKPDLINFDTNKQLLCEKTEFKTDAEWAFQYFNGKLFLDRYEALANLKRNNQAVSTKVYEAALNDKNETLRLASLEYFSSIKNYSFETIKEKLIQLATTDIKTSVRAFAIELLSEKFIDSTLNSLYDKATKEPSYNLIEAGLRALLKVNPSLAIIKCKEFENENNRNLISLVALIYSEYGDETNNVFFIDVLSKFSGFNLLSPISYYCKFLRKTNLTNETKINGIQILMNLYNKNSDNKWIASFIKRRIQDYKKLLADDIDQLELNIKRNNINHNDEKKAIELAQMSDSKKLLLEISQITKDL
jgi:aminopeptidase N